MANIKMQNYPRGDDYLADDKLFPRPKGKVNADELSSAIAKAFERSFKDKQGNTTVLAQIIALLLIFQFSNSRFHKLHKLTEQYPKLA
jgi:hypothetical protein